MQLRQPKAIGLLDDHDRRVRDVDADLDHRRRDEHVELARLEVRHQLAPLGRTEPSVQQTDAIPAQLRAPQPLGLRLRRARLTRLRLLDQRADHVRLPPGIEVLAQTRVRLRARPSVTHAVLIGLRSAGGRVISETARSPYTVSASVRGIGVAVMCKTCGDRPARERLALRNAEAMLLVDDGDREVVELDAFLDQRMRPDDEVGVQLVLDRSRQQRAARRRARGTAPRG